VRGKKYVSTKKKKYVSTSKFAFVPKNWLFDKQSENKKMRFHTRFLAQIQRFQRYLPILLISRDHKVIALFPRKLHTRKSVISTKKYKIFVFELVSAKLSSEIKRSRNFALDIFPVCKTDEKVL
jgi:hypothetical protein